MIFSRQSKNKRGCYERKSCPNSQRSLTSPQQQNQSGLQAEHLAQPSRNSVYKHFRSYPKVSTSAQQDVGRSSGCISSTSVGWFREWTILPTATQANQCHLRQTSTKCARCVQTGKNTSPTTQATQSLILPQTMSPDDSSLPAQAGFTRTFYVASVHHFLSSFCLCSLPLRFPLFPSYHLSPLSGFSWAVMLAGRMVLRSSGLAASNRQPLVWLYWVDTCAPVGRLVGGALVRVARAHGFDSGTRC